MMPSRKSAPLARAILHRVISDDALAGDLLEEFEAGRSASWLWRQILSAAWRSLLQHGTPGREHAAMVDPSEVVGLGLVIFGAAAEIVEIARSGIWWMMPAVLGGALLTSLLKLRAHHRTDAASRRMLLG